MAATALRRSAPWIAFGLYSVLVTSASAALFVTRGRGTGGEALGFGRALAWQLAVYAPWLLTAPALLGVMRRLRVRGGPLARRWLAPLPALVAASLVVVPLHGALYAGATRLLGPATADRSALALDRLPVTILLYWAIVGVLYAVEHARELRERERAAARLEAELARAELLMLRAQLQPHFLFNALQSIASLIARDPATARAMTVHLGDLLRATLERDGDQRVRLADELALLRGYLAIEAVRFGERLVVAYDVADAALDCLVPDLVLQPLAENALRHGLAPLREGGRLTVGARVRDGSLQLWVEDDGVGLPAGWRGDDAAAGHGLRITRQRLARLHGDGARLTLGPADGGRGTRAEVLLPATTQAEAS